jgi:heat shock protein HslJ
MGLLTTTLTAGFLVLAAVPASAGDVAATTSPVGQWRTRTDGVRQTITFAKDGSVFGDSGCNRFTGSYKVKGDRITIGPLASTMMACPEPQMSAETTFLTRLQAAVSYHATSRVLKVFAPKDMIRFTAK